MLLTAQTQNKPYLIKENGHTGTILKLGGKTASTQFVGLL